MDFFYNYLPTLSKYPTLSHFHVLKFLSSGRDAKPSDFIVSYTNLRPILRLYDFNCIPYDNS